MFRGEKVVCYRSLFALVLPWASSRVHTVPRIVKACTSHGRRPSRAYLSREPIFDSNESSRDIESQVPLLLHTQVQLRVANANLQGHYRLTRFNASALLFLELATSLLIHGHVIFPLYSDSTNRLATDSASYKRDQENNFFLQ